MASILSSIEVRIAAFLPVFTTDHGTRSATSEKSVAAGIAPSP
jgi:hypothetical protein